MTDKKKTAGKSPSGDEDKAMPPKAGTQAPQSGPYPDEVVIDADAPAPLAALHPATAAQSRKEQAAQRKLDNQKSDRTIRVRAMERGYLGNRLIEPGTVFDLELDKGQEAPRWVKPVDDDAVPTPPAHSSEAQPQPPGEVI